MVTCFHCKTRIPIHLAKPVQLTDGTMAYACYQCRVNMLPKATKPDENSQED
jgi:hypothetical protein